MSELRMKVLSRCNDLNLGAKKLREQLVAVTANLHATQGAIAECENFLELLQSDNDDTGEAANV